MSITLQQSPAFGVTASGTSITVTPTPITNGNGVVVVVGASKAVATIGDSTGTNTYTLDGTANFFGAVWSSIYRLSTAVGGITSVTVTIAATGILVVGVYEILGSITVNAGNATNANTATPAAGAFTTTNPNTIAIGCLLSAATATAQPSGYVSDLLAPGGVTGFGAAHLVYTSIQTGINPAWATNASGGSATTILAYTSTNLGNPPPTLQQVLRRRLFPVGPWPFGLPITPTWYQAPPAAAPPSPAPPVMGPIQTFPLSLRLGLLHRAPVSPPPSSVGPAPPTPPEPPGPGQGINAELLRRQAYFGDERRPKAISDKMSIFFNSLLRRGHIRKSGTVDFTLIGGAYVTNRDPTATDDIIAGFPRGASWINSVTLHEWVCVVNTTAAAIWKVRTS